MPVGQILLDSLLSPKILLDSLPAPVQCENGTIYGNYSVRFPTGFILQDGRVAHRAAVNRYCRMLPGTHIMDTETAFTRCWLRSFPERKVRKVQREALNTTRPPSYCQPSESNGDAFYVDISSAYWSIYSRLSWRTEYLRGQYFSNDSDTLVFPFPQEWKTGRSYVISATLPATKRVIWNGKVVETPTKNLYSNPPLVCAVWDVLAAIARYAVVLFDAHYFNVDGAVIGERHFDSYCGFLDQLGLKYKTKWSGRARIHNLASWEIGPHQTMRFTPQSLNLSADGLPVTMAEADWILDRFQRLPAPNGGTL